MKYINNLKYECYWIVFTQGTNPYSRFLKRGFSHVYVITKDKFNWIKIDPLTSFLNITILPHKVSDNVPKLLINNNDTIHIVKIKMVDRERYVKMPFPIGLRNCVTVVKYILSLKLFAITPYSLYKKLVSMKKSKQNDKGIGTIQVVY